MNNREWLLENADYPIKYSLTQEDSYIEQVLENLEVKSWLDTLTNRAICGDLSKIQRNICLDKYLLAQKSYKY